MTVLPLTSGAYSARSIIANAQRCVNLYPEGNPDATSPPSPVTHYLAPGLVRLGNLGQNAQVRGAYTATNGDLYMACGTGLYYVSPSWDTTLIGTLANRTSQVKMIDNGTEMLIVDGGTIGYTVVLATKQFGSLSAANNSGTNGFVYYGADWLDYIDGFIIGNIPGTPGWWATAYGALQFDPLSFGSKSGSRDPIQGLMVCQRNVWLVGTKASELWYDAGGANFPFALFTGPYVQHGTPAKYSLVRAMEGLAFISQDTNGQGVALMGQGYSTTRISTFAIEAEWNTYPTIADAIGFSYLLGGHLFVNWRFPTANKTWTYDVTTQQWHERVWTDSQGHENQWRVNCTAFAYGVVVAGDWENGNFYQVSSDELTDDGVPIHYRRGFPHVVSELRRVRHNLFRLDIQAGEPQEPQGTNTDLWYDGAPDAGLLTEDDLQFILDPRVAVYTVPAPEVWLRWSDDRGKTWSNPISRSIGNAGEYATALRWMQLGQARDRVYEVFWGTPQVTALNRAFIDAVPGMS